MSFISVTRLRVRRWYFMPGIALHSIRSVRQLRAADGFLGGYLASGPRRTLWTVSVWADQAAMRLFRNEAAHRQAMPKLAEWCDEAAVVDWESESAAAPAPAEAAARIKTGRTSKLRRPTAAHRSGDTWPDGAAPKIALVLSPDP